MASCRRRAPGARTFITRAPETSGRRHSFTRAHGFPCHRAFFVHRGPACAAPLTTVQIVREHSGGGWSTGSLGFASIRREQSGAESLRPTFDLSDNLCAGTTKNPRQTFRPAGGSVILESLFTSSGWQVCDLPPEGVESRLTHVQTIFIRGQSEARKQIGMPRAQSTRPDFSGRRLKRWDGMA